MRFATGGLRQGTVLCHQTTSRLAKNVTENRPLSPDKKICLRNLCGKKRRQTQKNKCKINVHNIDGVLFLSAYIFIQMVFCIYKNIQIQMFTSPVTIRKVPKQNVGGPLRLSNYFTITFIVNFFEVFLWFLSSLTVTVIFTV